MEFKNNVALVTGTQYLVGCGRLASPGALRSFGTQ